jgi:hypothetical protein
MKFSDYSDKDKNLKKEPPAPSPARRANNSRYKSGVVRRSEVRYTAAAPAVATPQTHSQKEEVQKEDLDRQKKIKEIERILSGLLPHEIIYPERFYLRHWSYLIIKGWLWFSILFISTILFILGIIFNWGIIFLVVIGLFLAVSTALVVWIIADWQNDHLIVTNLRACHIEKIPFFYKNQRDILVKSGPSIEVDAKRNLFQFIFNIGHIKIISQGQQPIEFTFVHKPQEVRKEIDKGFKDYFAQRTKLRRDMMDDYVEKKSRGENPPLITNEGREIRGVKETEASTFQKLFPFTPIEKIDRGSIETRWHRHWIILVGTTLPHVLNLVAWLLVTFVPFSVLSASPALIGIPVWLFYIVTFVVTLIAAKYKKFGAFLFMILWVLMFIFSPATIWGTNNGIIQLLYVLGYIVAIVVMLFSIWYSYENWFNDTLVVGFDSVINVVRLPFGFETQQNVIRLTNIQDTDVKKPTLWANLFNYGDVTITPAGKTEIHFKFIPDPEQVGDEIDRKREEFQLRVVETTQDRSYADFFATYLNKVLKQYFGEPPAPPKQ